MEIDTRHFQQYESYVADLVSGRLAIDPLRRGRGIERGAIVGDGVIRIGESDRRVQGVQRHLSDLGYQAADNQPLPIDGICSLSMQAAVLRFQRDHEVVQSGDLDGPTMRLIPSARRREVDRLDHFGPGEMPRHAAAGAAAHANACAGVTLPTDPGDRMLLSDAQVQVRQLDLAFGRAPDASSARMAAGLACLAKARACRASTTWSWAGKATRPHRQPACSSCRGRSATLHTCART